MTGQTPLENILCKSFSAPDARMLLNFFASHAGREIIADKDLEMTGPEKRDLLLLAYEERILIPVKSVKGPAWEDKIIDFSGDSIYFVPPVVWPAIEVFNRTHHSCIGSIINKTMPELSSGNAASLSQLLHTIITNSTNFMFEVGLLKLFYDKIGFTRDLHDIIDMFVIQGMMSPCPRKSLVTGLSWYEIHPVLFWGIP